MAVCWVDVSASSTTTKYLLWISRLSSCGQDGYNDWFRGRRVCVCVFMASKAAPSAPKSGVRGGSCVSQFYRFKSLFNKWMAIIVVRIKARNRWWISMINMTSPRKKNTQRNHVLSHSAKNKVPKCDSKHRAHWPGVWAALTMQQYALLLHSVLQCREL